MTFATKISGLTLASGHPVSSTHPRRIAHLDMDAFFASVELLRYPQLRGWPVVIGGGRRQVDDALAVKYGSTEQVPIEAFPLLRDYVGRGVITTATYAARQFGVGSAMGMMKAAKLCPQAIVLPVDFDEVRRYSRLFKDTILEIAPLMEDRGVDEVYIDFTEVPGGQRDGGRALARLIQRSILERTGLIAQFGPATGSWMHEAAWGRDDRPVVTHSEPVSMSRETTFERDLHAVQDKAELGAIFTRLCERVAEDLQRKGYKGRTIGIKLRFDNFKSITRDLSLEAHTDDARIIRQAAGQALKRASLNRRLRLLGVRVGTLIKTDDDPAGPTQAQAEPVQPDLI